MALPDACTFFYYGETHDYTVEITTAPSCPGIASVSISSVTKTDASVSWSCNSCAGPFIIEYGLNGFVPGIGATAGTGGTIFNAASSPATISGLNSATDYQVYVRRNCDANGYSTNFGPFNFTTLYDACGTLSTITCGTTVTSVIEAGQGEFDLTNCYLNPIIG